MLLTEGDPGERQTFLKSEQSLLMSLPMAWLLLNRATEAKLEAPSDVGAEDTAGSRTPAIGKLKGRGTADGSTIKARGHRAMSCRPFSSAAAFH
mmetsp:Transcript_7412/g.13712  ORF Transcript_7412/g.13712 Transcript_7412/m.13712 type:complete len:94 (-) Transcript_7412:1238-1519(-)